MLRIKGFRSQMGQVLLNILLFFKQLRNLFAIAIGAVIGFAGSSTYWLVIGFVGLWIAEIGYNFFMYRRRKFPLGEKMEKVKLDVHRRFNLIAYNFAYVAGAVLGLTIPAIFESTANMVQNIRYILAGVQLFLMLVGLVGLIVYAFIRRPIVSLGMLFVIALGLSYAVASWFILVLMVGMLTFLCYSRMRWSQKNNETPKKLWRYMNRYEVTLLTTTALGSLVYNLFEGTRGVMESIGLVVNYMMWIIIGIALIILLMISIPRWMERYTRWKARIMLDEMTKAGQTIVVVEVRGPQFDHFGHGCLLDPDRWYNNPS
ncbi:hypothetical protein [Seinonella peptonophila]|uniref:hypothetical protein n=1 Tax=Seinonella peptonophila TaxID=112248 RepID=UPI00111498BA|nr:hypothetical protein [Seinonella peptonophila]